MKTKIWKHLILFTWLISASTFGFSNYSPISTHIEYYCIGQDSFLVSLKTTVDCTNPELPDSVQIHVQSSCSDSFDVFLDNKSWLSGFCPRSICNGGDLPGVKEITYDAIVVLNSSCNDWSLSYSNCCRDTSINLIGSPNSYIETKIFRGVDRCSSSPQIFSIIDFAILNQSNSYNFEGPDPDNDNKRYFFATPLQSQDTTVVFKSGHSTTQPIPGITIDSLTGKIEFTPTTVGKYHTAIIIKAYSAVSGMLMSTIHKNVMFHVIPEPNNVPISTNGITNITGNLAPIGIDSFQIGISQVTSFDIEFSDTDTKDSISVFTNANSELENSTIYTYHGNPATLSISWVSPSHGGVYPFTVVAKDDRCETMLYVNNYTIIVGNGINSVNNLEANDYKLQVSPNPIKHEDLKIQFQSSISEVITINIYDLSGALISTDILMSKVGLNTAFFPISKLRNGQFILQVVTNSGSQSIPFMKIE